jgi:hypothetical protein
MTSLGRLGIVAAKHRAMTATTMTRRAAMPPDGPAPNDHLQAIVVAQHARLRADVVVSDWQLPSMSGLELCRALATGSNRPHVIYVDIGDDCVIDSTIRCCWTSCRAGRRLQGSRRSREHQLTSVPQSSRRRVSRHGHPRPGRCRNLPCGLQRKCSLPLHSEAVTDRKSEL